MVASACRIAGIPRRPTHAREGSCPVRTREDVLSELALGGEGRLDEVYAWSSSGAAELDARSLALVRLAALLTIDAPVASLGSVVTTAQLAGVSADALVRCLVALVPVIGMPRVVAVAPKLALTLGFDVEAALEAIQRLAEGTAPAPTAQASDVVDRSGQRRGRPLRPATSPRRSPARAGRSSGCGGASWPPPRRSPRATRPRR